jgi:acetyl esterase/lipase
MTPARATRRVPLLLAALVCAVLAPGAAAAQSLVIPVWPGAAPGSEGWRQQEVQYRSPQGEAMVRNVTRPTLTAYLPTRETATGTAIIVAPGGGFHFLSWESEGTRVAEWLQRRGVAAFVLRYRLVNTGATEAEYQQAVARLFASIRTASAGTSPGTTINSDTAIARVLPLATADGREAVRLVRARAAEWGVRPDRVGLMGFSAGGMVSIGVALEHDAASRPDFVAPIYGVPRAPIAVPADAPPLFDLVAADDGLAAGPSLALFSAWRAAGKPAELHVYAKGGHGFGMARRGLAVDGWIERLGDWLQDQGLVRAAR